MFFDTKRSNSSDCYYLEPELQTAITDFVEAVGTLIEGLQNHSETCIPVKLPRRTQKVEIYLAHVGSSLAIFSKDLGHTCGSNVGNEFE